MTARGHTWGAAGAYPEPGTHLTPRATPLGGVRPHPGGKHTSVSGWGPAQGPLWLPCWPSSPCRPSPPSQHSRSCVSSPPDCTSPPGLAPPHVTHSCWEPGRAQGVWGWAGVQVSPRDGDHLPDIPAGAPGTATGHHQTRQLTIGFQNILYRGQDLFSACQGPRRARSVLLALTAAAGGPELWPPGSLKAPWAAQWLWKARQAGCWGHMGALNTGASHLRWRH